MQHSRYKLAIFDLDGTLLDTAAGIEAALRHTIKELGYTVACNMSLSDYIGPPIEQAFSELAGLEEDALRAAADRFRAQYSTNDLLKATPYSGIFDLLRSIQALDIKTAGATYKREEYAKRLLHHFGFHNYFDVMHGSDSAGRLKKKDLIRLCIKECGINDPSRTVMIGDTQQDARGAAEAGVDFIAVTYGFGFHTANDPLPHAPIGIARTPMEILPFLKQ